MTITVIVNDESVKVRASATGSTDEVQASMVWETATAVLQGALVAFGFQAQNIADLVSADGFDGGDKIPEDML
jgi:putative exporter of polyketide antibiotics